MIKPTLREADRIDIYSYVQGIIRKLKDEKQYPYRTCLNCQHFTEGLEQCNLYNQRPPARVIAFGCSSHFDIEGIPF
jgi:hypothetical protein